MPRYARRPPRDAARTALDPVRRADEREIAMLEGQLCALDRDIKSARACLSRPPGGAASHRGHEVDAAHGTRDGRVRLTDGREICIRPIEPCDAPELNACFQQLTAVSRYRRFLSDLDHLTAHQLQYLTTVDHADHEALVAVEAQSGAGIGVARYVRDANDPRLAELAVVVTDAWQGCGVGTALLERLVIRARAAGIERLIGRSIVGRSRGSGARGARRRRRRPPAPPRHGRADRAAARVFGHASRRSPAGRVRLTRTDRGATFRDAGAPCGSTSPRSAHNAPGRHRRSAGAHRSPGAPRGLRPQGSGHRRMPDRRGGARRGRRPCGRRPRAASLSAAATRLTGSSCPAAYAFRCSGTGGWCGSMCTTVLRHFRPCSSRIRHISPAAACT